MVNTSGSSGSSNLANMLNSDLQVKTVFTIPIGSGIKIAESVVVMWFIIAAFIILALVLVRNLKVKDPNNKQLILEFLISRFYRMIDNMLEGEAKRYTPYLMCVCLFIGAANIVGIFGVKAPTKDLNVTIVLAAMSIVLVEYAGIRAKGVRRWAKTFTEPVALITPLNVLEIIIRPFSLCLRLFGNVLGAYIIMELIKAVLPEVVPMIISLYFDFFDGFLQAYIFVFLTALYLNEAVQD